MIRVAKAADTMAVIRLMQDAHRRSRYAKVGSVHVEGAKAFLARCVHFHGHTGPGSTFYLVSHLEDGTLSGFFIGHLAPVYVVGDKLEAQDIHCYLSGAADPKDYIRFLRAFEKWAMAKEDVIEITLSTSNYIAGQTERHRLGSIFEARGYEQTNQVFKRRIERT